ncbi:hypothetical protein PMI15_00955 [Polaromonas sp. CF318]|uniref:DUF1281 family ferredoxin-like fold protein n=1 Tax=Polaromonas sp. CF318 TaxID=1144318 RepID=UPI0002711EBC|nr:hypothetical protein [Polaromonas sp. CF318]EJL87587.1 hypothetical protein PMI15_00955 [Polaromonas sp. CF318]
MSDAVFVLLQLSGDPDSLASCRDTHFSAGTFDFNSVVPMPPELEIEESSAVTTGYDALYGDWTEPAKYWTWKESAAKLGHPFPLESREQLLACIRSLDCAEMYLAPVRQYQENIEKHGFGSWHGWCKKNWGSKWNAEDSDVDAERDRIIVSFTTASAFPKPLVKALSKKWPAIEIRVLYADEHLRWGGDYVLKGGRESERLDRPAADILKEIRNGGVAA